MFLDLAFNNTWDKTCNNHQESPQIQTILVGIEHRIKSMDQTHFDCELYNEKSSSQLKMSSY